MIKKILFLIVYLVVLLPNQINAQTYTGVLHPGSTGGRSLLSAQKEVTIKLDSTNLKSDFINKKLFLLGEIHDRKINSLMELSFLKLLNSQGIFPKFNIQEASTAVAYVLNRFLISGNWSEFGDDINEVDTLIIKEIRAYYKMLPSEQRFKYVGVDIERNIHLVYFCIRNEIIESKALLNSNDSQLKEILDKIVGKGYAWNWGRKDLRADLDLLANYITKNPNSNISENGQINQMIRSYIIGKKFKRLTPNNESADLKRMREDMMIQNIFALFDKDSSAVAFGRFGIFHVSKNCKGFKYNNYSIASELNENKNYGNFNNKVYSTAIFYTSFKHKVYKLLLQDRKLLKGLYSNKIAENKTILTDKLVKKDYINNVIIFK